MAKVANVTRGTVLATNADTARTFWQRFVGLMGRAHLPPGYGLVFPGEQGVHTLFMRVPIDVVFYGRDGVVLGVAEAMRPWRVSRIYFRAKGLVEVPAGAARASGTRPGDVLRIT